MIRRILALIAKEFRAILRDGKSRAVLVGPPLVQLLIFSYAATFEVNSVTFAVLNEDVGPAGRELVARFTGSPNFDLVANLSRGGEIADIVNTRKASLILHIGQEFSRDLALGETAAVQTIVDGRRSNIALVILGYAGSIIQDFNVQWARDHGGPAVPARLVERSWFNPNLSSQWFIVPGLVVILTMLVTTLVTAMSISRERELGTFEQLLVTPLRPVEIMIGKIIPAFILGLAEGSVIVAFAVYWFKVPLMGSLALLYAGLCVFLISVVGVGLMISSIARTQQQAIFGAFMFFIPATLLSGFATPIASMSQWVQYLTYLDPMRYCLIIVRGIFLEGMSAELVAVQLAPMALIGLATLTIATALFHRRLY